MGLEERFSSGLLTFQIQPFPKGVNIIVTEENIDIDPNNLPDDPEEFEQLMTDFFGRVEDLKQNGGTMADTSTTETKETKVENKPDPDFVFYSLEFENMSQLLTAVKNVKIDAEESELYSYQDKFYLIILDNQKSKGKTAVSSMRARMLEYGQETVNSRETLQEYGEILINTRALEVLSKI
ncbi:adaptor protein MecA [Lactococcus garvieae]